MDVRSAVPAAAPPAPAPAAAAVCNVCAACAVCSVHLALGRAPKVVYTF